MSVTTSLFYFFGALAAFSALGLLLAKNVLHGALLMIVCLLSLAGIYVLAFAEFVAVTQILIYAGGILIIIIFGIMLTSKISGKPLITTHGNIFSGILAACSILGILSFFGFQYNNSDAPPVYYVIPLITKDALRTPATDPSTNIQKVGTMLMSNYLLPFEIIGVLLLIALVGASVTATSSKNESHASR